MNKQTPPESDFSTNRDINTTTTTSTRRKGSTTPKVRCKTSAVKRGSARAREAAASSSTSSAAGIAQSTTNPSTHQEDMMEDEDFADSSSNLPPKTVEKTILKKMCNTINTSLPSYPNLKKSEPSPPKEKRDLVNAFLKAFPQDELPFKTEHQQYRKRVPDCIKYLYYLCIADEKRFKEEHKLRCHLYPESWKLFRNCCLDLVIDQNFNVPKRKDRNRKRDYSRLFQERLAWLPTMYQEVVGLPFTMNTKVEIPSVNYEIYPAFFSKRLIVMVAPNIKNNIQALQQMVYALCFSSETKNPDGVLMDEEDLCDMSFE